MIPKMFTRTDRAWPEAEAQSGSVISFADVPSHEQREKKWFNKWGTNRGLRPPIRTP